MPAWGPVFQRTGLLFPPSVPSSHSLTLLESHIGLEPQEQANNLCTSMEELGHTSKGKCPEPKGLGAQRVAPPLSTPRLGDSSEGEGSLPLTRAQVLSAEGLSQNQAHPPSSASLWPLWPRLHCPLSPPCLPGSCSHLPVCLLDPLEAPEEIPSLSCYSSWDPCHVVGTEGEDLGSPGSPVP